MYFLKRLFFILTFSVFITSSSSVHTIQSNSNNLKVKKGTLTVILVHSYNINHICGGPQEIGFMNLLNDVVDEYDIKVNSYYLNGKTKTDLELQEIGKNLAKKIQVQNPDLIVSFDDLAVQYVLTRSELNDYLKLSSGLNKLIAEYIKDGYQFNNFCGFVEEIVKFSVFKELYHKNKYLSNKKLHVITDKTVVSSQLLRDFKMSFNDQEYILHTVETLQDLNVVLKKLDPKKDAVVNFIQIIQDGNDYYLKDSVIGYISKMYSKYIQITTNKSSITFGADIVVGIDFYKMPLKLKNSLVNVLQKKCLGEVMASDNDLYVNYNSVKEGKFNFSKEESNKFSIVK